MVVFRHFKCFSLTSRPAKCSWELVLKTMKSLCRTSLLVDPSTSWAESSLLLTMERNIHAASCLRRKKSRWCNCCTTFYSVDLIVSVDSISSVDSFISLKILFILCFKETIRGKLLTHLGNSIFWASENIDKKKKSSS